MVTTGNALSLNAQICEKSTKESRQRLFLYCSILKRSSGTCINDSRPGLYVDAGSSLPGPEDPHERLSGEDAGCFTHLYIKQKFSFLMFRYFRIQMYGFVRTHVDDHADSGESSRQILRVWWSYSDRDDPSIEAAIKGSYQVDAYRNYSCKQS